jgi:hypothetical protein
VSAIIKTDIASTTYATITDGTITVGGVTTNSAESLGAHTDLATAHTVVEQLPDLKALLADQQAMAEAMETVTTTGTQVVQDVKDGKNVMGNATKVVGGNTINVVALAGNIITGNMDVDNAIASFQDPYKMAEAIKANPDLAATIDAFSKGQFDNLPKTKEGLQTLADATGLQVDVLLTTVTSNVNAQGATDKKLIALDVNPENRADIIDKLAHEQNHARGGTSETLADMSGYAAQLLSEVAIGSYDQQYLNGIKFELGTGNDTVTQAANQVLLGSDNETLLNALNDHQLEFYFKDSGYYTDPVMKKALGEGLPENHFINRFQNDTAKGFAGLENGLNRLYNLDTSKMSPVGKAAYEHLMVRAITAPAIAESDLNPMDKSGDMLIEQIKQFLNISKNNEKVDKE